VGVPRGCTRIVVGSRVGVSHVCGVVTQLVGNRNRLNSRKSRNMQIARDIWNMPRISTRTVFVTLLVLLPLKL
jgi:hypothetical protein